MIMRKSLHLVLVLSSLLACQQEAVPSYKLYQSSATGERLQQIMEPAVAEGGLKVSLLPEQQFQEIEGFGGAITEASAHLLMKLPAAERQKVLNAYFGDSASAYNLVRLHINSCDFSLSSYAYVDSGDTNLSTFSLAPDRDDIIPIAKQAQDIAGEELRFLASPWTAPPWMKDNKAWFGGRLLPKYYDLWAQYFVKYAQAYEVEGIPIWGFTVENEPLGNDANWESMHFSPEETGDFVKNHLGPQLKASGLHQQVLVYDQNRGSELEEWSEALLGDPELDEFIYGTAVHWYTSTFKWFPESLQKTHALAPHKAIWNTEACVDAEVPHWQDDAWYWQKEATDWGYTWAAEEDKPDHPKYVPVYRYARDIIGCLNNQVSAWIDWNIVLDRQGGPNHASNWCVAPVIADTSSGETYFTPLYEVLRHFSHFIKRGAVRIGHQAQLPEGLHLCALMNPNGEIVLPVLNTTSKSVSLNYQLKGYQDLSLEIAPASLQTLVISRK